MFSGDYPDIAVLGYLFRGTYFERSFEIALKVARYAWSFSFVMGTKVVDEAVPVTMGVPGIVLRTPEITVPASLGPFAVDKLA